MMEGLIVFVLIGFAPFLFVGIINRVKAIWAGRRGAPLLQSLYDFVKLMRKGQVVSGTTSFVFRIGPTVYLGGVLLAALLTPVPGAGAVMGFAGDFLLFAYVLGLGKFFLILSAMDTGSSFEGMGASREATFSTIVEPAFFILIGSLVLLTGHLSFEGIFQTLNAISGYTVLVSSLSVLCLFLMLLTEGARVPVDDPNTHLELTMIHEVMVLDTSGPDLAFIQYASALKMVVVATLMAHLLVPPDLPAWASTGLYLALLAATAGAVGAVESLIARLRMSHVPQFIFLMTALAWTVFASVLFFSQGDF